MKAKEIVKVFIAADIFHKDFCKKSGLTYNNRPPLERLNDEILHFYNYTGNDTDFASCYSFEVFKNLFYDAVCYDEGLPEDVQKKILSYFDVLTKVKVDEQMVNSALVEIQNCILQKKLDNAIKEFWIEDNDRKTKKVRNIIFNHKHECNSIALIRPLITWAENHNALNIKFIYKMFEYGYIVGKREERAKRKDRERREKGN